MGTCYTPIYTREYRECEVIVLPQLNGTSLRVAKINANT